MTHPAISRRHLPAIPLAALGVLGLAGCGGAAGRQEPAEAGATGYSIESAVDINEQPREALQAGGELTLPVGSFGPNWNVSALDGYFGSTLEVMETMKNVGCWVYDVLGQPSLNTDYFLEASEEILEDGTQVLHYALNPEAVWNDGTPIDWTTYKHTVEASTTEGFDAVASALYAKVGSVEMGEDAWHFTVTMAQMQQPWDELFATYSIIHPAVNTPDLFNEGFLDDPRPDWAAGPFILDTLDTAARIVSLVPNPTWWGEAPQLERVNFAQYETSATIPSFQNGQIDAVTISTADRYSELTSWKPEGEVYDIRRGQSKGSGGFLVNTEAKNLGDPLVRKAIFQAIDRRQLAEIRFQGLDWTEEMPGSWLLMPFDPRYQDNYPVQDADPEGARATLEEAGWTGAEGEIRSKDGEQLVIQLSTFGDNPTDAAIAQSFQTMMEAVGISIDIFNRGSGESTEALNTQDYGIVMSGYSAGGADPTAGPEWFWSCDYTPTGVCDPEMDERMKALPAIIDPDERAQACLDVEKEVIAEHFHFLIYYNGPTISAYRSGLANYGPRLFETVDWTLVGWQTDAA